jgi:protein SCO1
MRSMPKRRSLARAIVVLLPLVALAAKAHDGHHPKDDVPAGKSPTAQEMPYEDPSRDYFTDLTVVNQNEESFRFYTDLLKDKVVLISFFYTSCPDFCPFMMDKLARVKDLLGPRLGQDIHLIGISVDPEQDTPGRLRAFAEPFGVGPGWDLVTGKKENVEQIAYRLGQTGEDAKAHTTLLLAGNVKKRRWVKLRPDSPEPQIAAWLRELAGDGSSSLQTTGGDGDR